MKYIITFIFLNLLITISKAQPVYFNKTYDFNNQWDIGWDVLELDNGYLIAGSIPDSLTGAYCLALLRTNMSGDAIWKKSYGSYNHEYSPGMPSSLIGTFDGGYALGGAVIISGNVDAVLMKFNQNADTIWTRTYGDTAYQDVSLCRQMKDSCFILIGTEKISNDNNVLLIKTDKAGNLLWKKTFGNSFIQKGKSIDLCFDHGFIIASFVWRTSTGNPDVWVIKTDSLGNMQWNKYFGGIHEDYLSSNIIQTSDTCFIFSMITAEIVNPNPNPYFYKVHICKLSRTGNLIWNKPVGPFIFNGGNELDIIHELNDRNFIAVGQVLEQVGMTGWLFKFDANGDTIWSKMYSYCPLDFEDEYLRDMKPTADGGFIMAGFQFPSSCRPSQDMWVVKVDSAGCGQAVRPYDLSSQPVPTTFGAGLLITWHDSSAYTNSYIIERLEHNPYDYWKILNNSLMNSSSYKDTNLFLNTVYCYRVTAIDQNYNVSCPSDVFCFTTQDIVEYEGTKFSVLLLPNPATDHIYLKFDKYPDSFSETFRNGDHVEIEIYNILGQQISHNILTNDMMMNNGIYLNTINYPQGIYRCNIIIKNDCIMSKPFIIIK